MTDLPSVEDNAPALAPALLISLIETGGIQVQQNTSLLEVIQSLGCEQIDSQTCALILQGDILVGLVTERDIVRLIARQVPLDTPISEGMTNSLTVLSGSKNLDALEVLGLMRQRQIHHIPVVDEDGRPLGVITANSLQQTLTPPHALKLQPVQSLMTQRLTMAQPTDSASHVANLLAEYQVSGAVIVDDTAPEGGRVPIGLVFRQDVVRFQGRQLDLTQLAAQTMMREVKFCLQPTDSLWLAYKEMRQRCLPCLPVVDAQNQLLGMINQTDILNTLDAKELRASFNHLWHLFRQSDTEQAEHCKTHNAELERLMQLRTDQLEEQAKCDRILTTLTQRIHESLNLQDILSTTVSEVRQLLQADRAIIYQLNSYDSGSIVVESVSAPWQSLLGETVQDSCFTKHWAEAYRYGHIQAVEDIQRAGLSPCHQEMLAQFQIRANLVVPIVCGSPTTLGTDDRQLWGLLVVNQCSQSRRWRDWEIRLLEQLVRSVAIAIRQSLLYQQLQTDLEARKQLEAHLKCLNDDLEQQVEIRTASWRQVTDQLRQEIVHRSEAEQALATTNNQLQAVLDAVPGMVSWISAEGIYLGCNRQLATTFQQIPKNFMGQSIGFLFPDSPFSQFVSNFFDRPMDTAVEEIKMTVHDTFRHYLLVAQKYEQGSAAVFVGLDISEREQVKSALQESETRFRSLVEQTNDWVWELDQQLKFVYINPRATEIIGYIPEAILHRGFTDFMTEDKAIRFSTILNHIIQNQESFTQLEATCRRASGETIVLEISGSPIFGLKGELQGYRGITRDITERKQVEIDIRKALTKEKELNELKTRFISMASHEFRTPLTTILASAESLERYRHKFSEDKQRQVLQRIQDSVHHVIGLLNDVLTVGKAEAKRLACSPQPIDLKGFCLGLMDEIQFAQSSPVSRIELVCTGDQFQVLADEKLLRHIFINLLSNAVKYSPNHSPVLLELNCTQKHTLFRVTDTGIGIPAADQAKLFEAFHRANNVGNISGTGLGLVIAKRAVEAHHGTISFVSKTGTGTTFTVLLPLTLVS
ncbi:ATP-binding protein [Leptolyngbya sp. PCC 6406]|uniref:ATP-binding protein n=1 Tax=Leptolyngbya sp. PCC 6406 TaxID=1173264 RepID=UPI0002AC3FA1|nr:ATP-binding protein [Leptolyngbya sp. PCC 6406]